VLVGCSFSSLDVVALLMLSSVAALRAISLTLRATVLVAVEILGGGMDAKDDTEVDRIRDSSEVLIGVPAMSGSFVDSESLRRLVWV